MGAQNWLATSIVATRPLGYSRFVSQDPRVKTHKLPVRT
jgi:hypothetical protein